MLRPRSPGFTLVELAVGLAVLAILLAAGIPSFAQWIRDAQIRNASESLQSGIQRARVEALRRNRPVTFWLVSLADHRVMDDTCTLSASGASWVVSIDDPTGQCATDLSDTTTPRILEKQTAGEGHLRTTVTARTAVAPAGITANRITFNGFGRIVQDNSPIGWIGIDSTTSHEDNRTLELHISAAGEVRVCDPLITDTGDPRKC